MIPTVYGADCIHANIAHLPSNAGIVAGYVTGSTDIVWTNADWARHPDAVRIDQSPVNTTFDETADVLDYEFGAATLGDIGPWVTEAWKNFHNGVRVGQRTPAVYCSMNSIHDVANALVNAHQVANLAIADYNLTQNDAEAMVANASGRFPIVWVQYHDAGLYDEGMFSKNWLENRSKKMATPNPVPAPPGQWLDPHNWSWDRVQITGTGLNGHLYTFIYDPTQNEWIQSINMPPV